MAKKIVWENPDGTLRVSSPDETKKLDSETVDDFYLRMVDVWKKLDPTLASLEYFIIDVANIPEKLNDRNKWRLVPSKKNVIVDHSIELPNEKKAKIKTSARSKMKSGTPLNDDEIDLILR